MRIPSLGKDSRVLLLANAVLLVLCAASCVCNVLLVQANAKLRSKMNDLAQPNVGMIVPTSISGLDYTGHSISLIQRPGNYRVLLVFSAVCAYCKQNWPEWYKLFDTVDFSHVDVQLIDLTSLADSDFMRQHHASNLPIIHRLEPSLVNYLKLKSTPETILVGKDGRIKGVWVGVLSESDAASIQAMTKGA